MAEYWGGELVNGNAFQVVNAITRPADAVPYTAGDVVGNAGAAGAIHRITAVGPAGAHVLINNVQLRMSGTSVPSGLAGFRVYFFSAQPADAADNAVFTSAAGERTAYIDYVDILTPELIGGGFLAKAATFVGIQAQLVTTDLFAEIVTLGAFTPLSAGLFGLVVKGVALGVA